jgi:hypothetical protein
VINRSRLIEFDRAFDLRRQLFIHYKFSARCGNHGSASEQDRRGDRKRLDVRADGKLTAFLERESAAEPFSASSFL